MPKFPLVAVTTVVAALAAWPAAAQQMDRTAAPLAGITPPGAVPSVDNPNLAVASVRLEGGVRASRLIGAAVYGDQNERVGSVDDLIMTEDDKVTAAVIAVGGFLGIGSKLVVVSFDQLKRDADHVTLPGATKDTLNAMPNFIC